MPQFLTLCYIADVTNIHVKRWLGYFVEHGYRVYCLSDKPGELEGCTVIQLPNRDTLAEQGGPLNKTAVIRARRKKIVSVLRQIKPDVVHAIFLYQRGWSAALTNFHPWVVTLLGSDVYLPPRHYRNALQLGRDHLLNAFTLKQADMITAVSDELCQTANRMVLGLAPVTLIPIGIDPVLFQPGLDTTALRQQLSIPDEAFVILSPRQITPHYNQASIIESIPHVLKVLPNAIFVMKDTFCNTEERQTYVQSLKELAASLHVESAIRWVSEVALEELPLYYNLADVVVSVPTTDGMPVTIFEAMACQKPIIVGELPSYNEVIIHGQTGLRVPIRNSQALANAIIKMHQNPVLTGRMVEESQLILHQYGIFTEQMARMERYYHGLVSGQIPQGKGFRKKLSRLLFKGLVYLT